MRLEPAHEGVAVVDSIAFVVVAVVSDLMVERVAVAAADVVVRIAAVLMVVVVVCVMNHLKLLNDDSPNR